MKYISKDYPSPFNTYCKHSTLNVSCENECDCVVLLDGTQMVEIRMKKLMTIASTIQPPPPEKIIGNLSWVSGDEHLIDYIKVRHPDTASCHSCHTQGVTSGLRSIGLTLANVS